MHDLTGHHTWRNLIKLLKLSYRNLFRNKRRSVFAIMIAASGGAALSIAIGYYSFSIYSLQELTIRNGFGGSGGSGHVQVFDRRVGEQNGKHDMEFGLERVAGLMEKIKKDPDVEDVLPRFWFGGVIFNGNKSAPFLDFL